MRSVPILAALLLGHALATGTALAQTSPAFGPLSAAPGQDISGDMPLADYLGLLKQIAPAAESGARTYLGALQLRCDRALTTAELRQALTREAADDVPQWDDAGAMLALLKDAEATLLAHLNVGEEQP